MKYYLLIVCAVLSSCANWTSPMTYTEKSSPNNSYLYGRFQIDSPWAFLGFDGYQTIGLVFRCADDSEYTIRFNEAPLLQVIRLPASTCSCQEIIFTDADGKISSRNNLPEKSQEYLTLKPEAAYYLGDFWAESNFVNGGQTGLFTWKIHTIKDNFSTSSAELKEKYPNLNHVELINVYRHD